MLKIAGDIVIGVVAAAMVWALYRIGARWGHQQEKPDANLPEGATVFLQADGWYCDINGQVSGPWPTREDAEEATHHLAKGQMEASAHEGRS